MELWNGSFVHRTNISGTFDSICIKCVQVVATADVESDLAAYEHNHTCPGWQFVRLGDAPTPPVRIKPAE